MTPSASPLHEVNRLIIVNLQEKNTKYDTRKFGQISNNQTRLPALRVTFTPILDHSVCATLWGDVPMSRM